MSRFPEFQQDRKRILLFSRGRGRGHAIPDIEILRAIEAAGAGVEVRIVSYGLGADTFESFGYPVIDLGLPDVTPIAEMSVLAGRLIEWLNPDLVVAHEEFPVMPAAKIFDRKTIFLTDFFTDAESYSMHALKFADQILFLGTNSVFDVPPWASGKVQFVGRVLREFGYGPGDRERARAEMGIPSDAFVLFVSQGSWSESTAPLVDLMRAAFDALPALRKTIAWVAGGDRQLVESKLSGCESLVFEQYWDIGRIMAAADVAVTKSNRVTVFELQQFGVPTLALSWGLNPIDDQAISGLEGVLPLAAPRLTPDALASAIETTFHQPRVRLPPPEVKPAATCARIILKALTSDCR